MQGLVGLVLGVVAASLLVAPGRLPVAATPSAAGASAADAPGSWPGGQSARTVDLRGELGTDLSGLSYRAGATRASDVLWAVDDREGLLHRLVQRGGVWRPDTADGWAAGKRFTFPDGRTPDAEGLVVTNGAAWVSTERDETDTSRPSILRVPLGGTTTTLGRTTEWRLEAEFPGLPPNAGLEALDFVPDSFLVGRGLLDQARGRTYDPAAYPRKVTDGVFVVSAEAAALTGQVRAYVLNDDGSLVRVATFTHPLGLTTALEFDPYAGLLWLSCDNACAGRSATAELRDGRFVVTRLHTRPTGLPDHQNEGFTVAPGSRCQDGVRPVLWANDSNDAGHALRQGTVRCAPAGGLARATPRLDVTAPAARAGGAHRVSVRVSAPGAVPGGAVTLRVGERSRTGAVREGRVTLDLGTFRSPGRRTVHVSYTGDTGTAPATASTRLHTRKARTVLEPVRRTVRLRAGARARLVLRVRANGLPVSGRVRVRVDGRTVRATVRRVQGRWVVRTPVLRAPGRRVVVVRHLGTASTTPARARVVVHVR